MTNTQRGRMAFSRVACLLCVAVGLAGVLLQLWRATAQYAWSSEQWLLAIPILIVAAGICSAGALVVLRLLGRRYWNR